MPKAPQFIVPSSEEIKTGMRARYNAMMEAFWEEATDISGSPNYRATQCGEVISRARGRLIILLPCADLSGYRHVTVIRNGKLQVTGSHRLIALTFCHKPEGCDVVNHKNGVKHDNRAENLEWTTYSGNVLHAYRSGFRTINQTHRERCAAMGRAKRKLSDQQVAEVRELLKTEKRVTKIALQTGIHRSTIADIRDKKIYL